MVENPFTPGFGRRPVALAGRERLLTDFEEALQDAGLAERRSVLVSGARGMGKTVVLKEMAAIARDHGWQVLTLHTSADSVIDELRELVVERLRELDPSATESTVTGASVASLGSVSRQVTARYGTNESLATLLDRLVGLSERSGGLLVTLDEVQSVDPDELQKFAQLYQDLVSDDRRVGFVAAGLRGGVEELLDLPKTTFLRRAHRDVVGPVSPGTAAEAIQLTVSRSRKSITADAAAAAGEISQGYPYLMQYVGARAWESARGEATIELEDVHAAREPAIEHMAKNVHGPAMRDLSVRKREYLEAMLLDEGKSSVAAIAERMGVSVQYQSVYRDRLISAELIQPAGRGFVEFGLPYLREALQMRGDSERGVDVDSGIRLRTDL